MRKIRQFFLTTLVLLCSALTSWAAPYSGTPSATLYKITASNYTLYGFTTENWQAFQNYYAIASAEDLYKFAAMVNGGSSSNAVLTADIVVNENVLNNDGDLNGTPTYSWTPIGTYDKQFQGTFDGNGHTISGLYFENTTDDNYPDGGKYVGLIGYPRNYAATIKNVGVIDSYIKGYQYVGGICGISADATQTNCYNTGTVSGAGNFVGGICGYGYYTNTTNCYNTGRVSGSNFYVGGICGSGYNSSTTITNCYNTGTVSGNRYVGGICGTEGTQTNCYYLESCGSQNTLGVSATAEEFASGKITYLLNGSTSEGDLAWYQTLGVGNDAYPVLDKNHKVVYAKQPCTSEFSNTEAVKEHSSVNEIGFCPICGKYTATATLTDGVYQIGNAAQLYWFAQLVNEGETAANAVLTADIVVNENVLTAEGELNGTPTYSWTPIGTSSKQYAGTFDGNGHTISGLYFNNTTMRNYPDGGNFVGLIGYTNSATIKNVGVIDSYLYGYQYVGGICGYAYTSSTTTITNCHNTGTVSGSYYVGGICGYGYLSTNITNCHNAGTVSGSYHWVGGICGYSYSGYGLSGTQTNCYNTGTVSGSSSVGGICGYQGSQTNCYNTGTVSGSSSVGGICGSSGTQTNCYCLAGSSSSSGGVFFATAEEFASGKITYLLNGRTSGDGNAWRQNRGTDAYPVLDKTHAVIYASQPCATDFSNTEGAVQQHSTADAIGCCTACGQYIAQGATLVTESNYSSLNLTADFVGYYAISNSADLYWFAALVNNGEYSAKAVLTADIVVNANVLNASGNLNGTPTYSWTPIGTSTNNYVGTFDGNSHTISGLYFKNTTNSDYPSGGKYVGLIGYADEATIKNVGVIDSYIRGYSNVGGICGYSYYSSNTTITNCYNTGTVSGSSSVGGICGCGAYYTTITNCYNTGTVSNTGTVLSSYVGGICGDGGTQTNCYYLADCGSKNTLGISATAEEFESGKITYLLNGSTSGDGNVWRQNRGTDAFPVLDKTHAVIYATQPCTSGFSNTEGAVQQHSTTDAIGRCTACGQFIAQGTLVDESNYSSYGLTADFVGYYAISNSPDLYWFAQLVNNGETTANAVLTADIVVNATVLNADGTLNGTPTYSWTPIGTSSKSFEGTFDGNSHTISGLYFNNTTNGTYPTGGQYVGLIGCASEATIKNVGIIDSYIRGYKYVGGICGDGSNTTNCYNTGTVSGSSFVGGICGNNGAQTNCYNTGTVSGSYSSYSYAGGICGSGGTQANCYNTGTVSASGSYSCAGGICGYDGTQTNCYNRGTVSGSSHVGGICGYDGTQTNCYYLNSTTTNSGGATAEEFASGKVTFLLNGSTSGNNNVWRQNLGVGGDAYPVLDKTHAVVYVSQPCTSGFSNTENAVLPHSTADATGRCTACGQLIAQGTLVDENNYSSYGLTADFVGYYAISKSGELYWFANEVNSGRTTIKAVLTADIEVNKNVLSDDGTLNGTPTYSWTPIGTQDKPFVGTFDGNSHTISGLYFENTTNGNYVGLIGYANGATIKNVGVIDSYIKGYTYVGGICGSGYNSNTTITNCCNAGTVSGSGYFVGGICGYDGTQTNCYNRGTVSGSSSYVGGICGREGTQTNCYNTGTVSGSNNCVGGICGSYGTQNNCYNTGTVSGSGSYVGGICGEYGVQTNCYNIGMVSGSYSGGICGIYGTQTNCYYLEGSCSESGGGVSATDAEFASGKIGYLLNKKNNNAWYQDLYSDEYPLLDNTHNLVSGYIEEDGDTYTVVGNVYLATNYEIAEGKTLSVPAGASLTTTGEAAITNNGTLIVNGTVSGNNLVGSGSFLFNDLLGETDFVLNTTSYTYKGTAFTLESGIDFNISHTILGKEFVFGGSYTATYSNNLNVGTATVTITNSADAENVVSKEFTISAKDVELVWENTTLTYNGSAQKPTATATGMVNGEELAVSVSGEQTNAGTYTATASISDNNYKLPDEVTKEFTIGKATPTFTAPENLTVKCNETLSDITLPSGFAFENESAELAIGENAVTLKFTPEDADNYKVIEGIEVKVTKAAHTVVTDVAVAATCTEAGSTEGSHCSVCNTVFVAQEVIPAGHTAGEAVAENYKAPTCTEAGSVDSVVYCTVCKEELSRKTVEIEAAGHKVDSVAFENVVEATRTTVGTYDSVVYCTVCKVELSRKTVEVPQILAETIKLASKPAKVEYKQGETLDVKGGKITIGYSDKSTEDFEILAGWVSGFDSQKVGEQKLTVTFESVSSTLTTTFNVTVSKADDNTNTAIDEDAANAVNIYAYKNTIVVENATDDIQVYNTMGALVYRDDAQCVRKEITISTPGVYIVKTGNTAKRVMVY